MGLFPEEPVNRSLVIACSLNCCAFGTITLCKTYVDVLFLSTYPASWLPYLYLGTTVLMVLFSFLLTPRIARGGQAVGAGILAVSGAFCLLARLGVGTGIPGFAFALCLGLMAIVRMTGIISWSAAGEAFDVREFKRNAGRINIAGSTGATVAGFAVPVVVRLLGTEALLVVIGGAGLVAAALAMSLTPARKVASKESSSAKASPTRFALFRALVVASVLAKMFDVFADYAFKSELAASYSKAQIGEIMGPFYAVLNLVALITQATVTARVRERWGLAGLLKSTPIIGFLGNALLWFFPSAWAGGALRMGAKVCDFGFFGIGREIAAGPLPGAARRTAKFQLKGVVLPLGTSFAALIIWAAGEQLGVRGLAVLGGVLCLAIYQVDRWLIRAYRETLEDSIRTRRFGVSLGLADDHAQETAYGAALHALESDDPWTRRFGLELLLKAGSMELPPQAMECLQSDDPDLRSMVARLVRERRDESVADDLLTYLPQETDPEVAHHLFAALAAVAPESAMDRAIEKVEAESPAVRGGAVLVLMAVGDLDGILEGARALRGMVEHPDPEMRLQATRTIEALPSGRFESDLRRLLEDPVEVVRIGAIRAAGARQTAGLVPVLVDMLGSAATRYHVSDALRALGERAAPALRDLARAPDPIAARQAVRILARIEDEAVEGALLEVDRGADVATRTALAREVAWRVVRTGADGTLVEAAGGLLREATRELWALQVLATQEGHGDGVRREIECRQRLAERRLLHWLAVWTQPEAVLKVLPALTGSGRDTDRAAGLEFLETLAPDTDVRQALEVLEGRGGEAGNGPIQDPGSPDDPWLRKLMNHGGEGEEMDSLKHIPLLREVDLFQDLPGEILESIAGACELREITAGERLFSIGDEPDGMYIVASGGVVLRREGEVLAELGRADHFGEVGLLGEATRLAEATGSEDGVLLYMEKETFDRVTDDIPEVLRVIIRNLVGYLQAGGTVRGEVLPGQQAS
jgi:HEAT repeat protein